MIALTATKSTTVGRPEVPPNGDPLDFWKVVAMRDTPGFDSICIRCVVLVASAKREDDLIPYESTHVCDPIRLYQVGEMPGGCIACGVAFLLLTNSRCLSKIEDIEERRKAIGERLK